MKTRTAAFLAGLVVLTIQAQSIVPPPPSRGPNPTVQALDIYAELTGRTVLRSGGLPGLAAPIATEIPADEDEAVAFIEGEFANVGIEIKPDGEKFARVLPAGWTNSALAAQLARFQPPSAQGEKVFMGAIDFFQGDADLALQIYSEIRDRTVLRPAYLAAAPFSLKNRQALSVNEVIYALNVVFALNGVALVDDGDKFVQAAPLGQRSRVHANAPKAELGAALIDPRDVQKFQFADQNNAVRLPKKPTIRQRLTQFYATCYKKLLGRSPFARPPRPSADDLVAYYGRLTGYNAKPSKRYGQQTVLLNVQDPVTKAELLYALETSLALNDLTIVLDNDSSIRAGSISERNEANLRRIRQGRADAYALLVAFCAAGIGVLLLLFWLARRNRRR